MPNIKKVLFLKFGEKGYKGIFALTLFGSIALIVFGWRSITPIFLYNLGPVMHKVGLGLMLLSVYLLFVAEVKSGVKRLIRHPMLTGAVLWAIAHLIMNGDSRSVILFSTIGIWAILEIIMINRRDGIWIKSEKPPILVDIRNLVGTVVFLVVIYFLHPYITGMPIHG